ncbi:MAG: OstA-like protein [Chitinophagaceae bacterium]
MNYVKSFFFFILFILLLSSYAVHAQQTPGLTVEDTTKKVHILSNTRNLTFKTIDDSTKLTIVTGDVKMRQGTALFYCDSCVINSRTNVFEAWGKVHINDSDTAHIYSNHLRYLSGQKMAYLDGNVKLTDGKATLTTPDLEYDMQTKVGTYKNGGTVVNKKSVLTSKEGFYYTDLKDIYFKKNVHLKDPAYNIETDSLLYNTTTQTTRFISQTLIKDSSGRIIKTREGSYNQQTGKAEFGSRSEVIDGDTKITGDRMAFDDSLGIAQIEGNAVVVDQKNNTTIIGGLIFRNKKTEAILATRRPLMIIKQENDSIYITADTLFSARLSDLVVRKNSITADTVRSKKFVRTTKRDITGSKTTDTLLTRSPTDSLLRTDSLLTVNDQEKKMSATAEADSLQHHPIDTLLTKKPIDKSKNTDSLMAAKTKEKESTAIIQKDSLRSKTDTLLTQNIIDKLSNKESQAMDTIKGGKPVAINEKDSTNRYFEAYSHVRIFSDSLQSVCDSLFYSFKDSIFRLYKDPVVWAQNSQITGDTILLYTKKKKADKVEAFENSFLVNRVEKDVYNQIKSARMDGWFVGGNIDSVRAKDYAECIYYIQDEDSAYTGINQSKCDIIDIYFEEKQLEKVVFRSQVTGTLWPINQKTPQEMQLPNFRWLEERRPKTKFEMFE